MGGCHGNPCAPGPASEIWNVWSENTLLPCQLQRGCLGLINSDHLASLPGVVCVSCLFQSNRTCLRPVLQGQGSAYGPFSPGSGWEQAVFFFNSSFYFGMTLDRQGGCSTGQSSQAPRPQWEHLTKPRRVCQDNTLALVPNKPLDLIQIPSASSHRPSCAPAPQAPHHTLSHVPRLVCASFRSSPYG